MAAPVYPHSADHHHHQEKHFTQTAVVRDIVIGMSDGLTVPFALAAGLTSAVAGAADPNRIILLAGLAEIVAGSIAMGLGGYLSGKTEVEHYDSELKREYREIKEFNEIERKECMEIFGNYGLSPDSQKKLVDELASDDDKWVDFMMKFELGLEKPDINRARQSARNIGLAYIVGGVVPLSAYVFTATPHGGLFYSSIITVACLMVFGYYKNKVTGQEPWKGAIRTTAIGVIAAAAAFGIAKLFTL